MVPARDFPPRFTIHPPGKPPKKALTKRTATEMIVVFFFTALASNCLAL